LRFIYAEARNNNPSLPDFDTFRRKGIIKQKNPGEPIVAYKAFRENPSANPLSTPSGKIEIYSERLANLASQWQLEEDEPIRPLPEYVPSWEGHQSTDAKAFPLQMFGFHFKGRVHSTYGNVALLKDACRQELWVNPLDAKHRGIQNGDVLNVSSTNQTAIGMPSVS